MDNAASAGETVAASAAGLLRKGERLLAGLAELDENASGTLLDTGAACRFIADGLETSPFGGAARQGPVLAEMMPLGSDRFFSNAEVGCMLLRNAASLFRDASKTENAIRAELFETSLLFDWAADELEQAPGGTNGPELDALKPYIAAAHRYDHLEMPSLEQTARMLEDAPFRALVHKVFQVVYGREFDSQPQQVQHVWARRLAAVWLQREGPTPVPLTDGEKAAIAYAVERPRADWIMPPIVAGEDWRDAAPADAAVLLTLISEVARLGAARAPVAVACYCDRVRTRALACHGGVLLVEAQGYGAGGEPGLLQALIHGERVLLADGHSQGLHHLNERVGPQLDTAQARRDYFMLFVNWVRNGGSRFQPVETAAELARRLGGEHAVSPGLGELPAPVSESPADPTGVWRIKATVGFEDGLWDAEFSLTPTGLVNMDEETVLATDLPRPREVQDGWFVRLAETTTNEKDAER